MFMCCPMLLHASVVFRAFVSAFIGYQPYMRLFLGMYMVRIGGKFFFSALFKRLVTRRYFQKAEQILADSGGQKFFDAPFVYIVYSRRDGLSNLGCCPTRQG